MEPSARDRPSEEIPQKWISASRSRTTGVALVRRLAIFLLLAATVTACRPDGPTGVNPGTPIASVTLAPDAAELPVDGRLQLEATVRDDEDNPIGSEVLSWASSDRRVAEVDSRGEVTGRGLGMVTITASSNGVSGTAVIEVEGFLIGSAGGSVSSADGRARAAVPAGALSEDVIVTLGPASSSRLPDGGGSAGFISGSAYELDAGDGTFSQAVQLTVGYDPTAIPSGVPESSLRLRRASGESWSQVQGSSVDPGADEVRGAVDRSGIYGAVGVPVDEPPRASIDQPSDGSTFRAGEEVEFRGTATDREDGGLGGSSLVWTSNRDGQLGTGTSTKTKELSIGDHTITLTATDSKGQKGTDQIAIEVRNSPPEAEIRDPDDGDRFFWGREVEFKGRADDEEDGKLRGGALVWSSSIDGQLGTGESVKTKDLSIGEHTITLTATDSHGASDTDQIRIRIDNNPPDVTIKEPSDDAIFLQGRTITFRGSATDPEDGALRGGALVWTSNRDGQFGTGESVSTSNLSTGKHTITLEATDSHGDAGTDEIEIRIVTIF